MQYRCTEPVIAHLVVERHESLDARVLGLSAEVHHPPGRLEALVCHLVTLELD